MGIFNHYLDLARNLWWIGIILVILLLILTFQVGKADAVPVAGFSGTPTSGIKPLTVQFTDSSTSSTGVITSWSWNFGDGGTSQEQSPSYIYNNAGTFTVTLTVTDSEGSDIETKVDYIIVTEPPPVANFSGTPLSGVAPLSVTFTDTSTGTVSSWSWNFGDGGTSALQNPSHTYFFAGTYTVSLTVTGPGGSNTKITAGYITVNLPAVQQWAKTYGGTYYDHAYSIRQTSDGGYIVAGETGSFGASGSDAWILKLDSSGNVQWQKTYGGTGNDYAYSIQQTPEGGYVVAGERSSGTTGSYAWILKLDSSGNVQWQKTYGGTGNDYAYSIQQTPEGGYVVAGGTGSFSVGGSDIWVLKLDSSGNIQWAKAYGSTGNDYAYSIQQTSGGGYIVAGRTESFGTGGSDAWVLKLDSIGNVQWQKTYGSTGNDYAYSIQQASDGGYIVAGRTESFGAGGSDAWVLKLDGIGNVQWQKTYGGTGNDYAYSIQQTADSGYIMAGETGSFGAGSYNAWVLKFDGSGNVQWQKTYGGISDDYAYFIQRASDGGYTVAGGTWSFGAGGSDAWVLKLDSNGGIPGCNVVGASGAIANNTIVTITNTTVTGTDTNVFPQTSFASSIDTIATVINVCDLVPYIGIFPNSYNFGNVQVGSSSTAQTFTITSTGTAGLVIGTITLTGTNASEFSTLNDNCSGQTIAPSNSCTIQAVFSPTSTGVKSANLSIPSNAQTLNVPLSGTGTTPGISASPASHDFGNVIVGSAQASQTFTTTNTGTADLVIGIVTFTGANASEFAKDDNCSGQTLTPSGSCTVRVIFSPTSTGAKSANLSIPSNVPTLNVPLSGTGVVASISISPASYNFGNVQVGSSSTAQTFTISSTGTAGLVIGTITLTGTNASEFSTLNDNCSGQTIAPSNSCTIQAVFSPTSTGVKSANLSIPSNAPTLNVPLSGASVPTISASPASYNFGNVQVGSSSVAQTFTISSTGTAGLVIGTITLTGTNASEFSTLNDNCSGQTITPSNSCTIQAVFSPTSAGAKSANLSIPSNAPGSPKLVPLSGVGIVPGAVQWAKTYGGTRNDYAYSTQQTSDGGYVMAGGTLSFGVGAGLWNAWVVKLDGDGDVQWQNAYGGTGNDYAHSIKQTADGGYVVAGDSSFIMRGSDAWILKLDGNGNVQWQNTYGGTGNDYTNSIQQTSDGGYVVAGVTVSFGAGGNDAWVFKLDGNGNVQWAKAFGGTGDDYANAVQQTADGGYVVAGERSSGTSNSYAWVFKLDGNGNMQWQTFGDMSDGNGSAESIQKTAEGGYVVAGWTYYTYGGSDAWIFKLDGNGNVQWAKAFGGTGYNYAYSIQQISDGGYIVAGLTGSFGAGGSDAWVFKLDGNGNMQGQKTYGGTGNDYAYSIQRASDGGYIVAGETGSFGAVDSNAWVLKLDATGEVPGCSAIRTSSAITNNTSAAITNTTLTGIDTNISPQTSAISTTGTNATVTEACPFEESDPAVTYTGNWILFTSPSCSGGTLRYSCEKGAKADFPFNGTGIKWIVTKAKMGGMAKACLDGNVMCKTVDLYSATTRFQQILQKTGLTSGPHTVTIEVLGQKNPSSTNYCVDIDAFVVAP